MKKNLVFMALMLALFISILVFSGKARASNSELYENDKQIITLLEDYEKEYNDLFVDGSCMLWFAILSFPGRGLF